MKQRSIRNNQAKNKKLLTIALVVAIFLAVFFFFTGFLKYGYYAVRCGGMPVSIEPGSSFASGYRASYTLPGDRYYNVNAGKAYVCGEQEAISKGIEIDRYTEKGSERLRSLDE